MRKLLVRALPVAALAAVAAVIAVDRGWLSLPLAPRTIGSVPAMSPDQAAAHRSARYAEIASVEQLMGLPGHFARMEALYAMAGRAGSADVQNLIFQADNIADYSDRRDVLLILFARLTELDVESALALTGMSPFAADPGYEQEVWRRWGERDLDAALRHAAGLEPARRNLAAQALLASQGYWGNERTARIAERLGVEPDDRTRSARLDELARSDPAAAIGYVRGIESPLQRRQAAAQLGLLLGREGLAAVSRHAAAFSDPLLRSAFEDAAAQAAAEVDPAGTLERLLAQGRGLPPSRLAAVFAAVAGQDLGQALTWYRRVEDPRQRQVVGLALAKELTRADPHRALAWAREFEGESEGGIYRQVIATLAETDPGLALADAGSLGDSQHRMFAIMTIAHVLSEQDPRRAVALLDDIESPEQRDMLVQTIGMNWLQRDPEAALDWMLAADVGSRANLLAQAGATLVRQDLDAAIRLLPRLDKEQATMWRQQIAARIATERSVAQAQSFIAQYQGSAEYPQLMAAVVQGVSRNDAAAAVSMLDELPDGEQRWMLYRSVFHHYAEQDPRRAAEAVVAINGEPAERANLVQQVVSRWASADPVAAERWADNLPPGPQRDGAIQGAAGQWREITPSRRRLLESIGDAETRKQAVAMSVFRALREDPETAEQILQAIDLPAEEKAEIRQQLEMVRKRMGSPYPAVW
jgi:hypothetical protein